MSGKLLGPCPECGRPALVYRNARIVARDHVKVSYTRLGTQIMPAMGRLRIAFYGTEIRCAKCHKIRYDLRGEGDRVVAAHPEPVTVFHLAEDAELAITPAPAVNCEGVSDG